MASPKSEKKKKSASPKKAVMDRKKNKKISKPKPAAKPAAKKAEKKKVAGTIKAPMKPTKRKEPAMVRSKTPAPPVNEHELSRKEILAMREKLIFEFSGKPIPETLLVTTEIGDIVDQAGDERDRELSLLLTGRDKEKLQAINEALEKIREGTYGICEECGDKIGPGRLKVMPLAKYCVSCQSKLEKEITLLKKAEEDMKYRGLAYATGLDEEEA
jgi:DnaK suppressor protein